jgi:Tol biopolymer transport system component
MRPTIFPLRRSTAIALAVALVAGTLTLGGAIGLGIRLPGGWFSSAPHDTTDFDYSALGRPLKRLRHGYVEETLAAAGSSESAGAARATRRAARRVVIDFTNDDFERAYAVTALPSSVQSDTSRATRQADEPGSCLPAGGTAWYRYDAKEPVALFANTFGTSGASALAVFTGDRLGNLRSLGCDVNALGNAQVGFLAEPATYWFQVTRPAGKGTTIFQLAAVGATTIESITPDGGLADGSAVFHPDISGDGRYIAFVSFAQNLAPDWPGCGPGAPPENYCVALYLRDRVARTTTRVAVQGQPWSPDEGPLIHPSLSSNGRYLAFSAYTSPRAGGVYGGYRDAPGEAPEIAFSSYLYDRVTGQIELISRNSAGEPAAFSPRPGNTAIGSGGVMPSVSSDGRFVSFASDSENMGTPRGPQDGYHVYVRDRATGTNRLASTDDSGEPLHGESCHYSGRNISADGRFVTFMNNAGVSDKAASGNGQLALVYLWDGNTGRTKVLSKLPPGTATKGNYCAAISRDGSHVGFVSRDALLPEDTNGTPDVYVYEVATERLRRVSVDSAGAQTIDPNYAGEDSTPIVSRAVTLSADGRYAVFDSAAPNLVPGGLGGTDPDSSAPGPRRVYLHDLVTGATTLVSVTSAGLPLPGDSTMPYISADGRTVTFFNKDASGLVNVVVHELS